MASNDLTKLCEIAYKYGTDKCPQLKHAYTPYYFKLFNKRRKSIKKVLELGIGHYKNMDKIPVIYDPGLNRQYYKGASLKMWRDFFPNAMVHGADKVPEAMFEDTRIKTFLCDERKKEDLESLIKNIGADIDLVIDDASHRVSDQIFAAQVLIPLLDDGFTYIIEDVTYSKDICKALGDIDNLHFDIPDISKSWPGERLVVITKK